MTELFIQINEIKKQIDTLNKMLSDKNADIISIAWRIQDLEVDLRNLSMRQKNS